MPHTTHHSPHTTHHTPHTTPHHTPLDIPHPTPMPCSVAIIWIQVLDRACLVPALPVLDRPRLVPDLPVQALLYGGQRQRGGHLLLLNRQGGRVWLLCLPSCLVLRQPSCLSDSNFLRSFQNLTSGSSFLRSFQNLTSASNFLRLFPTIIPL